MTELKVKKWIIDKAQSEAKKYNIWFDISRRTNDISNTPLVEDDCLYIHCEEVLSETEKAVQVKVSTGSVDGSAKGWTLWVPKSQIMAI